MEARDGDDDHGENSVGMGKSLQLQLLLRVLMVWIHV